jgi:hypothetical protein
MIIRLQPEQAVRCYVRWQKAFDTDLSWQWEGGAERLRGGVREGLIKRKKTLLRERPRLRFFNIHAGGI